MRNFTRGILALALFLGAIRTGSGAPIPQSGSTDRLPSDSYPQWTSGAPAGGPTNSNVGPVTLTPTYSAGRGYLDDDGTFHTIVFATGAGKWGAASVDDNFHSRKANGYSLPDTIALDFPSPDAWEYGPDRVLHAVWIQNEPFVDEWGAASSGDRMIYRSLKEGLWSAPKSIVEPVLRRGLGAPVIVVSPLGAAHVFLTMSEYEGKAPGNTSYPGWYLGYASPGGGGKQIAGTAETPQPWSHPYTGGGATTNSSVFRMLDEGRVAMIYRAGYDASTGMTSGAHYTITSPGGGANPNQLYTPDPNGTGYPLVAHASWAVDSSGDDHILYYYSGQTQVTHLVNNGVSEMIPLPPGGGFGWLMNFDSRGRLHVFGGGGNTDHWIKTENGWISGGGSPSPSNYGNTAKALFGRNDEILFVSSSSMDRTLPNSLGVKDPAAHAPVMPGGSVDLLSGNLHLGLPLYSTKGTGPCQSMQLYFNSLDNRKGFIAPGWRLNYEMHVIDQSTNSLTLVMPDGRTIPYTGATLFSGNDNSPGTLERVALEYRLTVQDGTQYWFNASGKLRTIQDASANRIDLIYDNEGYLVQVTDQLGNGGSGRSSWIQYTPGVRPTDARRISRITDPLGASYAFSYSQYNLSGVQFSGGRQSPSYAFDWESKTLPAGNRKVRIEHLKGVKTPLGGNYVLEYLTDHRVSKVTDPLGGKVEITYDETVPVDQNRKTTVKDRNGSLTEVTLDRYRGFALQIKDSTVLANTPNVFPILRVFDNAGFLTSVTDRYGKQTTFTYSVPLGNAPGVGGLLTTVNRPKANATGTEKVLQNNYACAAPGAPVRLTSVDTYASPTGTTTPAIRTTTYTYGDPQAPHLPTAITHPDVTRPDGVSHTGIQTQFAYAGPRKQLTRLTNEEGRTTDFSSFDSGHGLARKIVREGGTQPEELLYDVGGNVTLSTPPAGGPKNEARTGTLYVYDNLQRLIMTNDAAGNSTLYDYDAASNLVQVIPPAGAQTTTKYDSLGRPISGSTPDGSWSRTYDAQGNVLTSTDLRGQISTFTYDSLGRVTESQVPGKSTIGGAGGGGPGMHVAQIEYDLIEGTEYLSKTTEKGAPANRITKTYVDNRGRTKRTLAPDNSTKVETFYDEQDQVVATQQLFNGVVQTCTLVYRDARDRNDRVRTQDVAYLGTPTKQSTSAMIYNKVGSVVLAVDPLGNPAAGGSAHKIAYLRDARERVTDVVDGKGIVVKHTVYGDDDLPIEVQVPDPSTKGIGLVPVATYEYSGRKELKKALDRNNAATQYVYNALPGEVAQVTDPLLRVSATTYDPTTRRPTQVVEAQGTADQTITNYVWQNGLLSETQVHNPETGTNNAVFKNFYDAAGRLERKEYPSVATGMQMAAERYFYNDFGEQRQSIVGSKVTNLTYSSLGQLVSRTWGGTFQGSETRTYNGAGLPDAVTNGVQTVQRTWNNWNGTPLDEIFAVGGASWKMHTKTTDVAGNVTALLDGENKLHEWPVDENNRPIEKKLAGQGVSAISYTPGGLVDSETLKNAAGAAIARTLHTYDKLGRVSHSHTVNIATNETLSDYGYTYDAAGQVTKVNLGHLGASFNVTVDNVGRIKTQTTPGNNGGADAPPFTNTLVALSQGSESAATSDAQAKPNPRIAVPARTSSYVYAASGIRTSQTVDGVTTTYAYNALNQLLSETSSAQIVTHTYDEHGNETQRVKSPAGQSSITETYGYNHLNQMSVYTNSATGAAWQYDFYPEGDRYAKTNLSTNTAELYIPRDGDVVTDYTKASGGAPVLLNTYVQGLGIDSKSMRLSGTTRRHYLGDSVGTVGVTMDDAAGVVETNVRDAWGQTIAGATTERYGFAQRERDGESGLVYMRHRMYDPRIGRFTQNDPIASRRSRAHYVYAANRPNDMRDPDGNAEIYVHGVNTTGRDDGYRHIKKHLRGLRNSTDRAQTEVSVDFNWAYKSTLEEFYNPTTTACGAFGDESQADGQSTNGLTKQHWNAARKLANTILELRRELDKQDLSEPINIIAHSQGTMVTLAALKLLKDKGWGPGDLKIRDVSLMGSTLAWSDYAGSNGLLFAQKGESRDYIENAAELCNGDLTFFWSGNDSATKLVNGIAVGFKGVDVKSSRFKNGNIRSIERPDATHAGKNGWWSGTWLKEHDFAGAISTIQSRKIEITSAIEAIQEKASVWAGKDHIRDRVHYRQEIPER